VYHISKAGNIVKCRARKSACTVIPPEELSQVHDKDLMKVFKHMNHQLADISAGRSKIAKPLPDTIDDSVIGTVDTDVERTEVVASGNESRQIFMRDTEGRAIAFVQVLEYSDKIELCDIEVRPEYRGWKLSARLFTAVEKMFGKELIHTGGYTPDGLKYIAPLFGRSIEDTCNTPSMFAAMSFVDDWDREWVKFGV
jgi:GNAT superfamily N-acetyltransferase